MRNVLAFDAIMKRIRFETAALAVGAEKVGAVAGQQYPHMHAITLALQAAKPAPNSLVVAVPLQDELLLLLGEFPEWFPRRDPFAIAEVDQSAHSSRPIDPGFDGAVAQRLAGIRNHQIHVDVDDPAEPAAGLASAQGAVKRKEIGRGIAIRDVAVRAMEMVTEGFPSPILLRHEKIQSSLAIVKGLLQGIRNSFLVGGAVGEAVDDDFKVCIAWGRLTDLRKITDGLLTEQPVEAGRLQAASDLLPWQRRRGERKSDHQVRAIRQSGEFRENRLSAISLHDPVATPAMEHGDLGEEQLKMIVKFRHRSDGGARRLHLPALVDGDRRRNALNALYVRLVHPIEKLPRIGGKAFDVPTLTFRVKNVESQRRFS